MYLGFNRGRSFSAVSCPCLSFRFCPKSLADFSDSICFWTGYEEGNGRFGMKGATGSCLSSCSPSPLPFQQPQSSRCLNPSLLGVWPASCEGNPDPLTTPKRVQPLLWKLELLSGWGDVAQPIPGAASAVPPWDGRRLVWIKAPLTSHCGIDSPLFLSIKTSQRI